MRYACLLLLIALTPASAADAPLAIRNATVETLSSAGRIERATIVVRDGKIAAVGKDVAIPDDAMIVDAAGGTVMPGVIDPYFEVTIAAPTADAGARTVVIRGRPVTLPGGAPQSRAAVFTRIADNFYPHDGGFKALPRIGLTRLNLVTSGIGQSATLRVTPTQPDAMLDRADGLAFASITNASESLDPVRQRLEAANRAKTSSSRPTGAAAVGAQLWSDVLDGKTPLLASAANPAAVLHALKALEQYKNVNLILFMGGDAVAETVDSLKGRNVRVILRPGIDLLPNTRDRFNPAQVLHMAGVDFAFSLTARPPGAPAPAAAAITGDVDTPLTVDADCPLFPVAMLVKTGLPRAVALEALTKRPAALLGVGATHGDIEPGKAADLLIFSGDPLDAASRLRRTIIDGRTTYAN